MREKKITEQLMLKEGETELSATAEIALSERKFQTRSHKKGKIPVITF